MKVTVRRLDEILAPAGVSISRGWVFKDRRKDGSVRIKASLARTDCLPGWTPPDDETYELARQLLEQETGLPWTRQGSTLVSVVPPTGEL